MEKIISNFEQNRFRNSIRSCGMSRQEREKRKKKKIKGGGGKRKLVEEKGRGLSINKFAVFSNICKLI